MFGFVLEKAKDGRSRKHRSERIIIFTVRKSEPNHFGLGSQDLSPFPSKRKSQTVIASGRSFRLTHVRGSIVREIRARETSLGLLLFPAKLLLLDFRLLRGAHQ